MSADNTILIMGFGDGAYRVGHFQNAENLYWDNSLEKYAEEVVPSQVCLFFNGTNTFENEEKAKEHAFLLYEDIGYVEYGIQTIRTKLTWKEVEDSVNENK